MRFLIRRFLIVLFFVFLAGGTSSARAESINTEPYLSVQTGSGAISESSYWDLVEESAQVASSLKAAPDAEVLAGLASLAKEWEVVHSVTLDDGQVINLDNSYLLSTLQAEQPDLKHISGIFEALLAAHKKYPSEVFTVQDLDSLNSILARPEFQWKEAGPNPMAEFWQKAIDLLLKLLDKLLGGREVAIGGSPTLFYWVTVIALAVVLFLVFRTLFVDFINEAQLAEDNIAEEMLTSESAFQKAQSLSRGGDYRSAVRFLYLSSLLLLDERGLLRYDRSKTNREYLRSISNSPELSKPLSDVIDVFDDVWYGYHSLDEEKFKYYSERVEELKDKKS